VLFECVKMLLVLLLLLAVGGAEGAFAPLLFSSSRSRRVLVVVCVRARCAVQSSCELLLRVMISESGVL
jgi:hypothetical protein